MPGLQGRVPTLRTIQRYVRALSAPDLSGQWSPFEGDPEDVAAVLPVLAAVLEKTEGRTQQLTREEAAQVARVCRAAPDIPPWEAYGLARAAVVAKWTKASTEGLDHYLALAPWRDDGERYARAFLSGRIGSYRFTELTASAWDELVSPAIPAVGEAKT